MSAGRQRPFSPRGQPVFVRQPVFESIPDKVGSHAPAVTAFGDGELLAAWYSYAGPGELDGSAIYMSRRPAGQDVGLPATLHIDRPEGDGNPVLYSEGDNVWFFQAVVPGGLEHGAHIETQRSADRGHTWSSPRVDRRAAGVRHALSAGANVGRHAVAAGVRRSASAALFFASADGENWTLRSVLTTPLPFRCIQPSVVELDSGRLLAVMRNTGRGWLWVTASDDGGQTWASPRDSGFPNPGSATALLRLASGNLVLVYNDSNADRQRLSITISGDDGVTWHPPRVLVDGDGDYAYPAAVQTPDGLIQIVYSHNRERIEHITLNEAWVVAAEGWGFGDAVASQGEDCPLGVLDNSSRLCGIL